MEENIIIKSELKNIKPFCIVVAILGLVVYIVDSLIVSNSYYEYLFLRHGDKASMGQAMVYAFGFGNGTNYILIPLVIACPIIAYVIYRMWSKTKMTVTNKRVYGITSTGKRVDLPLDSISAVGTSVLLSGVSVTTASGAIKFSVLKNRDAIYSEISKLLVERQNDTIESVQTKVEPEIPQSTADELKKYKDLLDIGAITPDEYEKKKKQLLEL